VPAGKHYQPAVDHSIALNGVKSKGATPGQRRFVVLSMSPTAVAAPERAIGRVRGKAEFETLHTRRRRFT